MRKLLLSAGFALAALPALAFDIGGMSDEERANFRAEIRAYLLENPEVLMEAIAVLEERQAQEQQQADQDLVASNRGALFDDGYSWIGGNPNGDVTIVEFVDYRCGFCRRAHPEVTELIETDGNIRLVMKEFPILGEQSLLASRFAIAVQQTAGAEAYEAVHNALILMRGEVNDASLEALAKEAGVDAEAVFTQMESPEVDSVIAQNRALAQALGITGTPTFVFEDTLVRGYMPLAEMSDLVSDVRAQ